MKPDVRFAKDTGREIFTGCELIVKGAMEAEGGVQLLAGRPGFPFNDFFKTLQQLGPMLSQNRMIVQPVRDTGQAIQAVHRAQGCGQRGMVVIGSRDLHDVSEALTSVVRAGTNGMGGGLFVCGDDPSGEFSSTAIDPRMLAQQLSLPLIEPATPQEIKDWVSLALTLGRVGKTYIGYLLAPSAASGGGSVECRSNQFLSDHAGQSGSLSSDASRSSERSAVRTKNHTPQRKSERHFNAIAAEARQLGLNRILDRPQRGETAPLGFIAAGAAAGPLADALSQMGLAGRLPVLRLGLVYPVDAQIVSEFAYQCRTIVVVEQGPGFVEQQVQQILWPFLQSREWDGRIEGKQFSDHLPGIPTEGRLNPSVLVDRLVPLIKNQTGLWDDLINGRMVTEFDRIQRTRRVQVDLPQRTSTFCTGCPHRDSSSVLLELQAALRDSHYMLENHRRSPVELVVQGEEGCHSLLKQPPNDSLTRVEREEAKVAGDADLLIEHKHVAFLEDGQFRRDGQAVIQHALEVGQDITYLLLGRSSTAMTHPHRLTSGENLDSGQTTQAKEMERSIQRIIAKAKKAEASVVRIDPTDRKRYRKLLEQTVLASGLKVIVVDKECGVTHHHRLKEGQAQIIREEGYLPRAAYMNIAAEICDNCHECGRQTGCPGLQVVETDFGPKVQTDLSSCVNDGACQRIDVCPAFEQITVIRKQPLNTHDPQIETDQPQPEPRPIHAQQRTWRCHVAGVGGSGVMSCSRVLAVAGGIMGYDVQFLNEQGMIVRSESTYSQLLFTRRDAPEAKAGRTSEMAKSGPTATAAVSGGGADLILGIDLLEAARSVDGREGMGVALPEHTAAIVNTATPQTTRSVMGLDRIDCGSLEAVLQRTTHPMRYTGFNVNDLCQRTLGSTQYAPTMLLGIAYQRGYLPVTLGSIQQAIMSQFEGDVRNTFRAFDMGRKIARIDSPSHEQTEHKSDTARRAIRRKISALRSRFRVGWRRQRQARQLRILLRQMLRATNTAQLDDALVRDIVIRAYDCLIWGGASYTQRYCNRLIQVLKKDSPQHGYAVTRAVVWNLAKVMLIKDEVYVASLLTSPEKLKQDRRRFQVNPADGDRIIYRFNHRLQFKLFGRRVSMEWPSRLWQLRLLSRSQFMRHVVPGWRHRREQAFRDWYQGLVDRFDWDPSKGAREYQRWLAVLSTPESVSGFRHVRYPKMEAAKLRAEKLLVTDAALFEPDGAAFAQGRRATSRTVRLPVLTAGR